MKTLIVITGPTGVGKSDLAVELALRHNTQIISADSRQIYRGIPIITAAPTPEGMRGVEHHFIGTLPLEAYFSAAEFETQALKVIEDIFRTREVAVVCGGSMMYVDALCHGIDPLPTVSETLRNKVKAEAASLSDPALLQWLGSLDPAHARVVDPHNRKRIIHAIEVSLQAGAPYSSLCTGEKKQRPFRIIKVCLTLPRQILFERINSRVEKMIAAGALDEARSVIEFRHLNSLNTVGFKELFRYLDGEWDLPTAIARLQKNTRVYAKKQLTWWARDPDIIYVENDSRALPSIIRLLE